MSASSDKLGTCHLEHMEKGGWPSRTVWAPTPLPLSPPELQRPFPQASLSPKGRTAPIGRAWGAARHEQPIQRQRLGEHACTQPGVQVPGETLRGTPNCPGLKLQYGCTVGGWLRQWAWELGSLSLKPSFATF